MSLLGRTQPTNLDPVALPANYQQTGVGRYNALANALAMGNAMSPNQWYGGAYGSYNAPMQNKAQIPPDIVQQIKTNPAVAAQWEQMRQQNMVPNQMPFQPPRPQPQQQQVQPGGYPPGFDPVWYVQNNPGVLAGYNAQKSKRPMDWYGKFHYDTWGRNSPDTSLRFGPDAQQPTQQATQQATGFDPMQILAALRSMGYGI